jgi:hypothetical protein
LNQGTSHGPEGVPGLLSTLKLGLKHAPAVTKYAIGALVISTVTIAILSSEITPSRLFPSIAGVIAIGLVVALFSQIAARRFKGPLGAFLAWSAAASYIIVTALFISSAFFGRPEGGAILMSRLLGSPQLIRSANNVRVQITSDRPIGTIDESTLRSIDQSDDYERIAALAKHPNLEIVNSKLVGNPGDTRTILVNTLLLRNGGIVTNGSHLTIEAVRLVSDNGFIKSFENPSASMIGSDGRSGGTITLRIYGGISGTMKIDLRGESGAQGVDGSAGGGGPSGPPGENAASGLFDCRHGAGDGGPGGIGSPGQPGSPGRDGGNGGNLVLVSQQAALAEHILFSAVGGAGGKGGQGGRGGPGGEGGPGGSAVGLCSGGGHSGPHGAEGPPGAPGKDGRAGSDGSFSTLNHGLGNS